MKISEKTQEDYPEIDMGMVARNPKNQ